MWARHLELSLGLWLVISPFVFAHAPGARGLWWSDLVSGALLIAFSLLAHWRPFARIHLAELGVAAWLILFGRFSALAHAPAAAQNEIVVGLLIAMLAIVPNHASAPPPAWRSGPQSW